MVLLRQGTLVLCGEEEGIPRSAAAQSQLAQKGEFEKIQRGSAETVEDFGFYLEKNAFKHLSRKHN